MGLEGVQGPPKKKLKQAQLNFCVSTENASNKRKSRDSLDGLAPQFSRADDPGTSNKKNVVINAIDKSKELQTASPVSSPNLETTPNRKSIATPEGSSEKAEFERQQDENLRLKRGKEEQKWKDKEERKKKKQEKLRLKEDKKKGKEEHQKRKEEDKCKKEEEKRKKEEDRRKKEEAQLAEERKTNLAKQAFNRFFVTEKSKLNLAKKDETEAQAEKTEVSKFMPFQVKSDMRLAMQVRHTLAEEEKKVLSEALASGQHTENTYLKELKNGRKPKTSPATWPLSDEQHGFIIVEHAEDNKVDVEQEAKSTATSKGLKAKLLQFQENRHPPYWRTWRKPSKVVGPRRPFGQDKILDHEFDSDLEWEDEEGEDIEKEDGDSDKEEGDDENVGEDGYMLDNTFVPHGYLSEGEAAEAEDEDSVVDRKLKLTVLKQEFDQELNFKIQRLQPRVLGCIYIPNAILEVSKSMYKPLIELRCKWDNEPIDVTSPAVVECSPSASMSNVKFPSSMVEPLAKLVHRNRSSMKALTSEFMSSCEKDTQLVAISKRAVSLKVKEIAAKTYCCGSGRLVWAVNPSLCAEFGLEPVVGPQKMVPVVSPVVKPPKPKDSPLANFLKKTSTPHGPKKRVSTTLVPRDGPSDVPSPRGLGAVRIDTPKFMPQGSSLASHPGKPIKRVSTVLLSSVAGPMTNTAFGVSEIDKRGQSPLPSLPNAMSAVSDACTNRSQ